MIFVLTYYKYIALLCLLYCSTVHAQDIIVKTDGTQLKVRQIQFTNDSVTYRIVNLNPYGDTYMAPVSHIMPDSDIRLIKFKNGLRDTFNITGLRKVDADTRQSYLQHATMYRHGIYDANKYYEGSYNASTLTMAAAIITTPVLGLIPAIACTRKAPARSTTAPSPPY